MTPPTELWQAAITWLATHAVTSTIHWPGIAAGDPGKFAKSALIASPGAT